eukprot:scaffold19398_cov80-Skeletonema_menzelii.AAC.1
MGSLEPGVECDCGENRGLQTVTQSVNDVLFCCTAHQTSSTMTIMSTTSFFLYVKRPKGLHQHKLAAHLLGGQTSSLLFPRTSSQLL